MTDFIFQPIGDEDSLTKDARMIQGMSVSMVFAQCLLLKRW